MLAFICLVAGLLRKESVVNGTTTIGGATAAMAGGVNLPDAVIENATETTDASPVAQANLKDGIAVTTGAINVPDAAVNKVVEKMEEKGTDLAPTAVEPKKKAPLRCELILDVSLDKIHGSKGGLEQFGTSAQRDLAQAAEVDSECIHIMNLRGAYKHRPGAGAFFFVQARGGYEDVIVDFEILDCTEDMDKSFSLVEAALSDAKSSLNTGDLGAFLDGATLVKGGKPGDTAVARLTANGVQAFALFALAVAL